jgi:hypothetical protein
MMGRPCGHGKAVTCCCWCCPTLLHPNILGLSSRRSGLQAQVSLSLELFEAYAAEQDRPPLHRDNIHRLDKQFKLCRAGGNSTSASAFLEEFLTKIASERVPCARALAPPPAFAMPDGAATLPAQPVNFQQAAAAAAAAALTSPRILRSESPSRERPPAAASQDQKSSQVSGSSPNTSYDAPVPIQPIQPEEVPGGEGVMRPGAPADGPSTVQRASPQHRHPPCAPPTPVEELPRISSSAHPQPEELDINLAEPQAPTVAASQPPAAPPLPPPLPPSAPSLPPAPPPATRTALQPPVQRAGRAAEWAAPGPVVPWLADIVAGRKALQPVATNAAVRDRLVQTEPQKDSALASNALQSRLKALRGAVEMADESHAQVVSDDDE